MIYTLQKRDWIKYPHYCDILNEKVKIAYARCPKCKRFISIYKNEIDDDGLIKTYKKCDCKFIGRLKLNEYE